MKELQKIGLVILGLCLVLISTSCQTTVKRVNPDVDIELDGYWSDTDVRIVCEDIIAQVIDSKRIEGFRNTYKKDPIVTIGNIRNESDEYIDTEIVANNLKTAILKSGKLEFMANSNVRQDLRDEIAEQEAHAKKDQVKRADYEDAADFMLSGSIKTMVQNNDKKSFRTYFVHIDLDDIESGRTVDSFQPSPKNQPRKLIEGKKR